jgi:hypothetical protein
VHSNLGSDQPALPDSIATSTPPTHLTSPGHIFPAAPSKPSLPAITSGGQLIAVEPVEKSSPHAVNVPESQGPLPVSVPISTSSLSDIPINDVNGSPKTATVDTPVSKLTPPAPVPESSRRSHRTITPSTRADRMNEIGMKDNPNKENEATQDTAIDGPPEWMTAAHVYLSRDMGDEW